MKKLRFIMIVSIPTERGGYQLYSERNYPPKIYRKIKEETYLKCIEHHFSSRLHTRCENPFNVIRTVGE